MGRVMRLVYERVWHTDIAVLVGLYPTKPAQQSKPAKVVSYVPPGY